MARTLFPILGNDAESTTAAPVALPLAKDCAWDFAQDRPVFRNGSPVAVTGNEAVRVWAYQVLRTARRRYEIWSTRFGCDLERLIGKNFSSEAKRAEASRYITECLTVSPYIAEVTVQELNLEDDVFTATVHLTTIYGEEDIHV